LRHGKAHSKRCFLLCLLFPTPHKSLDTLLAHAHEVDRDADPAEGHVDYGNGK